MTDRNDDDLDRLATFDVLEELREERATQREQWGNDHDDEHAHYELTGMARSRTWDAAAAGRSVPAARRLLIQAAALLVAEVERLDREAARQ